MTNIEKTLQKLVKPHYAKKGGHDFDHIIRITKLAKFIASKERNVDKDILIASCLLHDVARKMEDEGKCKNHEEEGSKMTPSFLKRINFPKNKIEQVAYCVRIHRKSKRIQARTMEAKILQDADKLDIFGAIGIARTFSEHAKDMVIHSDKSRKLKSVEDYNTDSALEMIRSLLYAKTSFFNTKTARNIEKKRLEFIRGFVNQFDKEWAGK